MPELAGYWFDDIGVAQRKTRARFSNWSDLDGIDVVVTKSSHGRSGYTVIFSFTRLRQIRVVPKPEFFWPRAFARIG